MYSTCTLTSVITCTCTSLSIFNVDSSCRQYQDDSYGGCRNCSPCDKDVILGTSQDFAPMYECTKHKTLCPNWCSVESASRSNSDEGRDACPPKPPTSPPGRIARAPQILTRMAFSFFISLFPFMLSSTFYREFLDGSACAECSACPAFLILSDYYLQLPCYHLGVTCPFWCSPSQADSLGFTLAASRACFTNKNPPTTQSPAGKQAEIVIQMFGGF